MEPMTIMVGLVGALIIGLLLIWYVLWMDEQYPPYQRKHGRR